MYLNLQRIQYWQLAEWWEPPGFQAWFYKPYRDIVNKKMGVVVSGDGVGRGKQKGLEILMPEGERRDGILLS